MQEVRLDGTEKWSEGCLVGELKKAVDDPKNTAVGVYKDCTIFTSKDGKKYAVDKNGTRRRIEEDKSCTKK